MQRTLDPPGGGNAVAAWMLHALARRHELTTLTERPWDADRVNAFYGTAIDGTVVRRLLVGRPWRLLRHAPGPMDRLHMAVLLRTARRVAPEFDVRISADGYAPIGVPAVQYLHFPVPLHPEPRYAAPLVQLYFRACDGVSGVPWTSAGANLTIANSHWTAERLPHEHGGRAAVVVYPPVVDTGPGLPWEARPNHVLAVARFHGSKRFDVAIDIARRVRASAPDLRLTIAGSMVDRDYAARLRRMVARDTHWIDIVEDLPRAALNRLMGDCRYGLHAMVDEHFGMATAEMARAGCLVFPHASGGSPEVVGGDAALLWRTPDEAVARMRAMMADASLQALTRARLARTAAAFSTERFVDEIRLLVEHADTAG